MRDRLKNLALKMTRIKVSGRFGIVLLGIFASLFLIYTVLGFWVLPAYIKSRVEDIAGQKLHRTLVIQKLAFNPFTFSMNIEGARLSEPNSEENFASFDQLMVDVSPMSVLRMTPVVTEFRLVRPFVRVVRFSENKRNYDDIFSLFGTSDANSLSTDREDETVRKRPRNASERRAALRKRKFGIYNFQIIDGRIDLENREKQTKTIISKFNVGLPYLYRGPIKGITRFVELRFDALINGKKLEIVREEPVKNSRDRVLKLNMDNIDLTRIFNYVPLGSAYKFKRGWLDLHLSCRIQRPENAPVSISIGGAVTVRSVYMTQSEKPLLDLERLNLHLGTISLENREYRLEKIEIIKPRIHAVSDRNGILNFLNLLASNEGKQTTDNNQAPGLKQDEKNNSSDDQQEKMKVSLDTFEIKKAQLYYDDQSRTRPVTVTVSNLDLVAKKALLNPSEQKGSYFLHLGNVKINNESARLKGNPVTGSENFPLSLLAKKFSLVLNQAEIDFNAQDVSIKQVDSLGGHFEVFLENSPPKVPVIAREQGSKPFSVHIGRINIKNWSARLVNSNRLDPFEMPYLAKLLNFGLTVDDARINSRTQKISADTVASGKGEIHLELLPFQKPASVGKRAVLRAALLTNVIEAKKSQSSDGFAIHVGKIAVSDWIARLKNQNTTDRSGIPVSGRADNMNFVLGKVQLDTRKRHVDIAEIVSDKVSVKGQIEKHKKFIPGQLKAGTKPVTLPTESPYTANIGRLSIKDWSIKGRNINLKKTIGSSIRHLTITGKDLSSVPGRSSRFSAQATVNETGKIQLDGKASFSPLNADIAVGLKNVSIIGVQPYIDDYVNLTIDRANLSATGNFILKENALGVLEGGYKGDITLGQLNTIDQINRDPFIRWNSLDLKNVDARLNPLSISIEEAEFSNFFTRLILNTDGRLNLRNILRSEAGGQVSLTETDKELDDLARISEAGKTENHIATMAVKPEAGNTDMALPLIVVEKIRLKKGRVRFTDNFIKPHYTANISDMEGTITGFTSDPDAVAKLDIRGFVNRAPLVAAGTISPLKEHLTLDINAQVRGMELAQFSSYTAKYIGYGIDKGKLSFDVEYKLKDGVLVAQNRLVLDQLTFGKKSPGEAVTSLPVELAVSLLKDSKGVIDINLPIGGSLEDPNFSIGEILAKVFLSSIKRIILSPFAFLSLEFGGNKELAWIGFEPGSFDIPQKEIAKLEILAKALTERPALKLDITGRYDSSADRLGLARMAIQRKMKMLKRKEFLEKGENISFWQIKIENDEYPVLLERIYLSEDFEKPRNMIGLQKKIPVAEMEKLLEDNYVATEEEFMDLAYRRSEFVKDWFVKKGRIADSRLFILASKAGQAGENGETAARVDFSMQ